MTVEELVDKLNHFPGHNEVFAAEGRLMILFAEDPSAEKRVGLSIFLPIAKVERREGKARRSRSAG